MYWIFLVKDHSGLDNGAVLRMARSPGYILKVKPKDGIGWDLKTS